MGTEKGIFILYDGDCPICRRKTAFLTRRDHKGRLSFTDIRSDDLPAALEGMPMGKLEKKIHAVMPDGTILQGMDVIRAAYHEIGMGWLAAPTGWPVLRPIFDALYSGVAKYRLQISKLLNWSK